MKENKNAVPVLQHLDGGSRENAWRAALPCSTRNHTIALGKIASTLSDYRRPVTAEELACILDVDDRRVITRMVQHERLHGAPICASCDAARAGFYLARSPGELARYLRALEGRIRSVTGTYSALSTVYDDWTGQQRLDGWGRDDGK